MNFSSTSGFLSAILILGSIVISHPSNYDRPSYFNPSGGAGYSRNGYQSPANSGNYYPNDYQQSRSSFYPGYRQSYPMGPPFMPYYPPTYYPRNNYVVRNNYFAPDNQYPPGSNNQFMPNNQFPPGPNNQLMPNNQLISDPNGQFYHMDKTNQWSKPGRSFSERPTCGHEANAVCGMTFWCDDQDTMPLGTRNYMECGQSGFADWHTVYVEPSRLCETWCKQRTAGGYTDFWYNTHLSGKSYCFEKARDVPGVIVGLKKPLQYPANFTC